MQHFMGTKHRNLFDQITSDENLRLAYYKAAKGKKKSGGYLKFKENDAANLASLQERLKDGTYQTGEPRRFWVYEPKPRPITALPFADRVVQHALINVIGPIFEKGMMPQSYACRKGRGMHSGARTTQSIMRKMAETGRPVYVLKTDFSKYFYSIDRAVLWKRIEKKITCRATLWLIERFTPRNGEGLPIGNLTSQLWANVYGDILDRYIGQKLKHSGFVRYMDDMVLFAHSRAYLESIKGFIEWFSQYTLRLFFSKWSIKPIAQGVNFLGYRIFKRYKLLRKDSVIRAKRKIRKYRQNGNHEQLKQFIASWHGHAQHADTHNLLTATGVDNVCTN
ncbi:MAG: reverse transcriptase/maturase family protein [Xanthomonadaceae bacterium]|nr:reverse transcriptase/maturase family protein [Xanthomonadaceae bacterium]